MSCDTWFYAEFHEKSDSAARFELKVKGKKVAPATFYGIGAKKISTTYKLPTVFLKIPSHVLRQIQGLTVANSQKPLKLTLTITRKLLGRFRSFKNQTKSFQKVASDAPQSGAAVRIALGRTVFPLSSTPITAS